MPTLIQIQEAIRSTINEALLKLWREHEVSIVHLGKLERIEFHAYSEAYELHKARV